MEELLFKSGVRDGQDLGQVEKVGAFPKSYSRWHCCSCLWISGRVTVSQLLKSTVEGIAWAPVSSVDIFFLFMCHQQVSFQRETPGQGLLLMEARECDHLREKQAPQTYADAKNIHTSACNFTPRLHSLCVIHLWGINCIVSDVKYINKSLRTKWMSE